MANNDLNHLGLSTCVNRAPAFAKARYSFSIAVDAAGRAAVGAVSPTHLGGGGATYAITAGNGAGRFAVNESTEAIMVGGALDYETVDSYKLTPTSSDGNGCSATVTVVVAVTDVAETPPA